MLSRAWTTDGIDSTEGDHLLSATTTNRISGASRRVFLSGSSHDNPWVYEAIEAAGCVIVGEDHDWGEPGIELDLEFRDDPLDAFLDRLSAMPPVSAKASVQQRTAYAVSGAVAANADAVVAYIRDGDAGPRWDVADQRGALQALGIPLLLLDDQPYQIDSAARISATVNKFLMQAPR